MQLSEELTSTENKVAFARQAYNDAVMTYNNAREIFPEQHRRRHVQFRAGADAGAREARSARGAQGQFHLTCAAVPPRPQPAACRWTSSHARPRRAVRRAGSSSRSSRRCCSSSLALDLVLSRFWPRDRATVRCVRRLLHFVGRNPGAALFWTLIVLAVDRPRQSLQVHCSCARRRSGRARARRRARCARHGDLKRKRLHNVVEEMAIASGVPMPEIYVLEHETASMHSRLDTRPRTRPSP